MTDEEIMREALLGAEAEASAQIGEPTTIYAKALAALDRILASRADQAFRIGRLNAEVERLRKGAQKIYDLPPLDDGKKFEDVGYTQGPLYHASRKIAFLMLQRDEEPMLPQG